MSMLPDDPESTMLKRLKKPKPEEGEPSTDEPPPQGQRSSLEAPQETAKATVKATVR
jgi:membrane protein required for colicin V production